MSDRIRVVQWTSGRVARECVRAIHAHPDLELVGLYAYSAQKAGRDIGELVGMDPIGLTATNDVQSLLALEPDCVCYTPLFPDVDELVTLLEAGVNVVTTSVFLTGWSLTGGSRGEPEAIRRIAAAAERGGASIFGTGMNPGFASYLACVLTGVCHRIDHVRVTESVDVSLFAGDDNMEGLGWGLPPESPGHAERLMEETRTFGDAIEVMAMMLGVELDEKRCTSEFACAKQDLDLPGRFIARGTVAGIRLRWEGLVGGKPVLELQQVWVMSRDLEPAMPVDHSYTVEVRGDPNIVNRTTILPAGDLTRMGKDDFHAIGMTLTALPAVNAIPAVCRVAPGIRTYADLPTVVGHGRVVSE